MRKKRVLALKKILEETKQFAVIPKYITDNHKLNTYHGKWHFRQLKKMYENKAYKIPME